MDAIDVAKVCLRRWYVALPIILLALGAGVGLVRQEKPEYTAYANFALIYPQEKQLALNAPDPRNLNPLAANAGGLLGEALKTDLMTPTSQHQLGGVGNRGTGPGLPTDGTSYTVSLPQGSQTYQVQTWGPSRDGVLRVIADVLAATGPEAKMLQDRVNAPADARYVPFVTTESQVFTLPPKSPVKLMIAMAGLGCLAGGALAVAVEQLMRRRTLRRQGRADADTAAAPPVTPQPPVEQPARDLSPARSGEASSAGARTPVLPVAAVDNVASLASSSTERRAGVRGRLQRTGG